MNSSQPQALPGFEATLVPADMADVGADLTHKRYTGERLRKCYPGKYALAVRAYFDCRRSVESICDILKIDKETMAAVVEQESIARGVFEHERRIQARTASVKEKMLDKLNRLLDDPEAVESAGIFGLAKAIKSLSSQQVQADQDQDKKRAREEAFDVPNEYEEIVDAVIVQPQSDGFLAEKKSAREDSGTVGPVDLEDVRHGGVPSSTTSISAVSDVLGADGSGTVQASSDSVRQYSRHQQNKGVRGCVANSVDNSRADRSTCPSGGSASASVAGPLDDSSASLCPVAPSASDDTPGAGGVPGAPAGPR